MRRLLSSLPLAWLLACTPDPTDDRPLPGDTSPDLTDSDPDSDTEVSLLASCGDGVLDTDEECDDGDANSDTNPDACRTDCLRARCGDAVVDAQETCDDGNPWGGDGCDDACQNEPGRPEFEPNDTPWDATPADGALLVHGRLHNLDTDCWTVEVPDNGFLHASILPGEDGTCAWRTLFGFYDDEGEVLTTVVPQANGCAVLDASENSAARYLDGGTYHLCVTGELGSAVPAYTLQLAVGDDSCLTADWTPGEDLDPDGDGLANPCDEDDDNDGILDAEDNCPTAANGPDTVSLSPNASGFLQHWLLLGPFGSVPSPDTCEPAYDAFADPDGVEDAAANPQLGGLAQTLAWSATALPDGSLSFLDHYSGVSTPREAYAATWVHVDADVTYTLGIGADDGFRVWVNGDEVLNDSTCHGVYTDHFTPEVDLVAGWNLLMVKVHDQGGGWGVAARFLDGGSPVTDLGVSWTNGPWDDNQSDLDGDGLGDACDPTPAGTL